MNKASILHDRLMKILVKYLKNFSAITSFVKSAKNSHGGIHTSYKKMFFSV